MLKLNTKFDADSLLHPVSHSEYNSHTVHMLTQQHLLPPLTSTVKSSFFMHVHSSPLSLAARLHWGHANHFCYINNGWTFSGQTLYVYTLIHVLFLRTLIHSIIPPLLSHCLHFSLTPSPSKSLPYHSTYRDYPVSVLLNSPFHCASEPSIV